MLTPTYCQKLIPLKHNELTEKWGAKKRGPQIEGKSNDVYENKGRKNGVGVSLMMLLKTNQLTVFSDDVVEQKGVR